MDHSEPGFADTSAILTQARAQIRQRAQAALEEGARQETQGNFSAAFDAYAQALRLDPEFTPARSAEAALRARVKSTADETMRRAGVEDAFGRTTQAVALYRRVVELLPEGDPTRAKAQARLNALQVNRP